MDILEELNWLIKNGNCGERTLRAISIASISLRNERAKNKKLQQQRKSDFASGFLNGCDCHLFNMQDATPDERIEFAYALFEDQHKDG